MNGTQVSQAYELFLRLIEEGKVTNDGDPRWAVEIAAAQERSKGGRFRSWDRYASQVPVLVAASLAVWGLQEFGIPVVKPEAKKDKRFVGRARVIPARGRESVVAF